MRISDINTKSVTIKGEKYAVANLLNLAAAQIEHELRTAKGMYKDNLLEVAGEVFAMQETIRYATK